jgi:unsaturated chondroitin disaccharide hydrolase
LALYGFTASAKAAGNPEYLTVSEALAEYYLKRLSEGGAMVPFWDFDDPQIPGAPRKFIRRRHRRIGRARYGSRS